jgi:hypothetical protein
MHAIQLEPAGGSSREDRSRTRKADIMRANDQEPSQKLKHAKLAIAEVYQENMELRRKVVKKIMEASTVQGCEGNVAWLKQTAQRGTRHHCTTARIQRLMEERHTKYSREYEVVEKEACVALASAQKK